MADSGHIKLLRPMFQIRGVSVGLHAPLAKMAVRIEAPFGVETIGCPRSTVLDVGPGLPLGGEAVGKTLHIVLYLYAPVPTHSTDGATLCSAVSTCYISTRSALFG